MTCTDTNTPQSHKIGISSNEAAYGATGALAIDTQLSVINNGHQWIESFSDDGDENNGTPDQPSEGVASNVDVGTGSIVTRPRADTFRVLLPLLTGGTWSVDEIESDFICNYFRMQAEKNTHVQNHLDCKTGSWALSSSKSQPKLQLDWAIESCNYAEQAAGSFTPSLDFSTQNTFVHTSSTITIGGTTYPCDDITMSGNNNLTLDESYNSTVRTALPPGHQLFQLACTIPANAASVGLMSLGATSVTGQVIYTAASGALSLTVDYPALHSPVPTPITPAGTTSVKHEGLLWTARTTGTGLSLVKPIKFTLDDTP